MKCPKHASRSSRTFHTGGASKKVERPLKLLVMGDYSNGQNTLALGERTKVSVNKNSFNSVLADLNPKAKISVVNTLTDDGSELPVDLDFPLTPKAATQHKPRPPDKVNK